MGRPKGARNKRTEGIRAMLDGMHCNPVKELARMALEDGRPDEFRAECFKAILPYYAPRLTASKVEMELAAMPSVKIVYETPEGEDA